ncbi:MAG: ABC transporter permease [Deltaproteobacteria bacterium]|nr:ABC transporter permease [Deltaproteobacteria bacterium]
MGALTKIAWRNLYRQGRRTIITATAMAVGSALCIAGVALTDGMYNDMFDSLVTASIGHVQVHHPDYPKQKSLYETMDQEAVLAKIDALGEESALRGAAPRAYGFSLLASKNKAGGARLQGILPSREKTVTEVHEEMVEGEYLPDVPEQGILLGDGLAKTLKVKLGDELVAVTQAADGSMGNELYRITGIFHTGNTMLDRGGALLHLADLQSLLAMEGKIHEVSLQATDRAHIDALTAALRSALPEDEHLVRDWRAVDPLMGQMLAMQDASVWILLALVFSVAGLGILNTMLMAVFERTKELGVMRALGMRPYRVVMLVLMETGLLGLLSAAIGAVGGALLTWKLVVDGLDLTSFMSGGVTSMGVTFEPVMYGDFRVDRIVLVSGFVIVVSLASAIWPAFRAARLDPVTAMREDG